MDEEQIIKACESGFQSGGPRVYRFEALRNRLVPSGMSAAQTLRLADEGDSVWSRRKVGNQYRWRAVHKAIATS